MDYIFNGGRIGVFGTEGFKNIGVVNTVTLAPGAYLQTVARLVNQYGVNFLFAAWGKAYFQGNIGYLRSHEGPTSQHVGADFKLIQPITPHVAFTAEAGYNESYLQAHGSGQIVFGLQAGTFIAPKDYTKTNTPVPMDVPRIRYEFATRKVGTSPPIADAGPNQYGVNAGTITLVTAHRCAPVRPAAAANVGWLGDAPWAAVIEAGTRRSRAACAAARAGPCRASSWAGPARR